MVGCALCVPKEAKIKEEGPPLASNCISSSRPPTLPIYDLNKESLAFSLVCKFLPHLIHRVRHYKVLCFRCLLTDCKIWGNRRLVSLSLYAELIGSEMKLAFAISQGRFRMNGPHRRVFLCKPMGARSIKAPEHSLGPHFRLSPFNNCAIWSLARRWGVVYFRN